MSKELPSIDDDLAPRKRVDLRAIQPRKQADQMVEENSRRLGDEWGAQTSLERPTFKTPLASLRIEVPDYLDRELAMRAAEQRVTKQILGNESSSGGWISDHPLDLVVISER